MDVSPAKKSYFTCVNVWWKLLFHSTDKLIGRSLLDCHNPESRDKIQRVVDWFAADKSHNFVYTFHNEKLNKDVYMVALRDEGKLIGYYEKHEYRNVETMKQYDLW